MVYRLFIYSNLLTVYFLNICSFDFGARRLQPTFQRKDCFSTKKVYLKVLNFLKIVYIKTHRRNGLLISKFAL